MSRARALISIVALALGALVLSAPAHASGPARSASLGAPVPVTAALAVLPAPHDLLPGSTRATDVRATPPSSSALAAAVWLALLVLLVGDPRSNGDRRRRWWARLVGAPPVRLDPASS
jgi:hypothetical protein